MKTSFFILLAVLVLLTVGYFIFDIDLDLSDNDETPTATPTMTISPTLSPSPINSPDGKVSVSLVASVTPTSTVPSLKVFNVTGSSFAFSIKEMKVKLGDKVRVVFFNQGGFHDWVVDEFNAKIKQLPAGQTETIEFIADKKGTFEYYCSVGTHRQMGMKGNLIVE